MEFHLRNANIGIAFAAVLLCAGGYLFRHSEGVLQIFVLATFFAATGLTQLLNARDDRRKKDSQ
jgi:hypothetical protein